MRRKGRGRTEQIIKGATRLFGRDGYEKFSIKRPVKTRLPARGVAEGSLFPSHAAAEAAPRSLFEAA